jgi:hypothetical protein
MSESQKENQQHEGRSVGETIKDTQSGKLAIGSVQEILEAAPKDIKEEILEIPEWGLAVKVRSFTASQSARIRQIGVELRGDRQLVSWGEMEMAQVREGVIEPQFKKDDLQTLYRTSGVGIQRIIKWLDENSGLDKEEVRKTREEFQGSTE